MGLNFDITADNRTFINSLHQITAGVRDATRQIEANGNDIDRVINMIKGGIATLGVATGFKEISSQVANVRGQFQQLEVAFETMLGNKEKSDALMAQMIKTAAITPFGISDVTNGAKSLLAYGVAAEDVNDTLIRLGDIAAGLSIPLNNLTYLYGTTIVQGRMFTQDLRQFQGRGIPIADELAKQFGVATNKVGELVTAGKVGAKEFQQAIISMTSEGSKFGGLMEKQSHTITGQISNIEDAIEQMFNEIGKQSEGIINATLSTTTAIVENWQTVAGILGTIATAYGAQKAALALDAGFTKAATNYGYDAEISQLQALLPLKEAEKKTALEQAVASGNLSEAKATQVAALRAEAEAYLETLAIKQKEAQQAEITAQANLTTALQEKDIADEFVASAQEKWQAAYDSADAIAEEAAAQELQTAKTMQSEAADAVATATKEAKAASSAHVTSQQNLENASTTVNTAQTAGNTAATGILTIAKEKLAAAIAKVNAAMKANQFAIITGAVISLGYAVYKLITYQNDYQKSLSRLDDSEKEYNKSIIQEQHQIDVLFGKLKNAKKGTQEYNNARDAIMKNYGSYLSKLGDEKNALNDIAKAYKLVQDSAIQAAKARALNSYLEKEDSRYIEDQADNYEKIRQIVIDTKGETFADIHEQDLRDIVEGRKKINQKFLKKFDNYVTANGITYNANRLAAAIGVSDKRRENYNNAVKIGETRYGIKRGDITNPEGQKEADKKEKDRKYWEQQVKDSKEAYEAILKTDKEGSANAKKAYDEAVAELNKYNSVEKKQTGASTAQLLSKTAAEEQQVTDLLKKQAEERLRQQLAYEYELWQNRIDLMDEGETKVIAQMRLDNAKELTALKERQEQEIQAEIANQKALFDAREDVNASKDKKYAKKVFNPGKDVDTSSIDAINERYTQLYADLEAKQAKAEQDRLEAAKESMNAYLQEFGNYQQKRLAIQDDYEIKIAEAQNAGQRMQLMAQRNQKISDLDFNEWQDNGGMALAFGDVSKLSKETITQLIRDMEQYREKVIATFDPDKIQKYEEALNNLRLAEVSDTFFNDVNGINEALRERISLIKQIADEEAKAAELKNQKSNLEWQLNNLAITPTLNTTAIGPDGNPAETTSVVISEEDIRLSEELRVKLDEVNNLIRQSADNTARLQSNLKQSQKIKFADIKKFASNLLSAGKNAASLASIFGDELADAIETGVNSLETMLDSFEEIGSSIDRLANAGKEAVNKTVDASMEIVEGASAGMQASAAATATSLSIMEKASAILAIIGAAIQVATLVASLFNSDKKHEKNIEKLQDRIDNLQKSYDRLGKSASEAFSSDAAKLIEQQEALTRQQIGLVQMQMQEEQAKKKSDKDKIKGYQDTIDDLYEQLDELQGKAEEAIFGEDVKSSIENFASAYSSAWENGESRVASARDTVRKMMRQMVEESIKAAIQSSGAMDNIRRKMMDFYADGILTTTEQDYIYGLADELQKELDARFGAQGDLLSGSYSQNPTSGGWDTMSQDSADALNGRFTALAETGENIRAINAGIAENIIATLSVANLQRELMQDALNIHIINMGHLETISKNTRELAAMRENLDKIERYVRNI